MHLPVLRTLLIFFHLINNLLYQFRQCPVIDAEGKRLEVHRTDVHGGNLADVPVAFVLFNEQHGFSLVVQFRADMSPRVLIPLSPLKSA